MSVVPFLEESPRWLAAKDRRAEAAATLSRLEDEPEGSEVVRARLLTIQHSIELDGQGHSSNPFARTPNRHINRTLIAIGVNVLAQLSGINVITFYSNSILENTLGYTAILSRVISSCKWKQRLQTGVTRTNCLHSHRACCSSTLRSCPRSMLIIVFVLQASRRGNSSWLPRPSS